MLYKDQILYVKYMYLIIKIVIEINSYKHASI